TLLRVSLRSRNSVFMSGSNLMFVHLRASRYGGHSFATLCMHSEARARKQAGEGVRKGGVEPPKPFGYRILSPARLPVPPLSRNLCLTITRAPIRRVPISPPALGASRCRAAENS